MRSSNLGCPISNSVVTLGSHDQARSVTVAVLRRSTTSPTLLHPYTLCLPRDFIGLLARHLVFIHIYPLFHKGFLRTTFLKHTLRICGGWYQPYHAGLSEGHRQCSLYEEGFPAGGMWAGSGGLEIAEIWLLHTDINALETMVSATSVTVTGYHHCVGYEASLALPIATCVDASFERPLKQQRPIDPISDSDALPGMPASASFTAVLHIVIGNRTRLEAHHWAPLTKRATSPAIDS